MSNASPMIGPDLRNALVAMVKKRVPDSEVEDIVQSTLADAFASPHAPADAESFRRWIFGVAKNKVVDYHRRAGRETFDVPENIAGNAAPHQEADMLRWAEKHLPPGDDNKATLDWMLREGDGEKLESIAESEHLPAPRVRQRVSRLRRHLKQHWQKEVALLAALGVLVTALVLFLKRPGDEKPIANEDVARAEEMRKQAFDKCDHALWQDCIQKLDEAKKLDPAGDAKPAVQHARDGAAKALRAPPPPSSIPSSTFDDVIPPPPNDSVLPDPTSVPTDVVPHKPVRAKQAPVGSGFYSSPPPPPAKPEANPSPKIAPKKSAKPAPRVTSDFGGSDLGGSDFGASSASKSGGKDVTPAPAKK